MRSVLTAAVFLLLAAQALAEGPAAGTTVDELQNAIAQIREKVDAQRVVTGAAAKDAAERAAELDRLVIQMAALEHENDELRQANAKLHQDLDDALRKSGRLESEKQALAQLASTKLDELIAAGRQLASARAELDRVGQLLGGLEAGRAVLTAVGEDLPLLVAGPKVTDPAMQEVTALRAELDRARSRINELEAAAR
jgi:DNA repair exonuclease SbcCD ATPase subunit